MPATLPDWELKSAHGVHILIYVLLIAQPTIGVSCSRGTAAFQSSSSAYSLCPIPLATNEGMKSLSWHVVHTYLGWSFVGAGGQSHIAAALRHHFVLKNDVLRRMLPGGGQ